jgi:hypothetical protein
MNTILLQLVLGPVAGSVLIGVRCGGNQEKPLTEGSAGQFGQQNALPGDFRPLNRASLKKQRVKNFAWLACFAALSLECSAPCPRA